MSMLDWPKRAWNWVRGGVMQAVVSSTIPQDEMDLYDVLDAWYSNNDLYKALFSINLGPGKDVRALGNPAHEVVEFHAAHLWPETLEELPLEADKESIEEAARTTLEWSNWGEVKQTVARWFPRHGHIFLKAERLEETNRYYVRLMEPRYVTDYTKDPRGFITMIRLDVPVKGETKTRTHTELWEKRDENGRNRFRSWEHDSGPQAKIEDLGTPDEEKPLTAFGVDFVPFVHASFQSNGIGRGDSAFAHALEAISELDTTISRSHDSTFVEDPVVLKRNEAGGAAVTLEDLARTDNDEGDEVELGEGERKRKLLRLPGMASVEILAAPIDAAALGLIANQWEVIIRKCPELLYFVMQQKGDPSGVALSLKLAPAQDRGLEGRYNGEGAIIQCLKMCLTLNASAGIEGFANIGTFEAGDFDGLKFGKRQLLPLSDQEKSDIERAAAESQYILILGGMSSRLSAMMKITGMTEEEARAELQRIADERALFPDPNAQAGGADAPPGASQPQGGAGGAQRVGVGGKVRIPSGSVDPTAVLDRQKALLSRLGING